MVGTGESVILFYFISRFDKTPEEAEGDRSGLLGVEAWHIDRHEAEIYLLMLTFHGIQVAYLTLSIMTFHLVYKTAACAVVRTVEFGLGSSLFSDFWKESNAEQEKWR